MPLEWKKVDMVCFCTWRDLVSVCTVPETWLMPSSEWVHAWTCNQCCALPGWFMSSLKEPLCRPRGGGWQSMPGWGGMCWKGYWTSVSGNWLGEAIGEWWQVLPEVIPACVKAQWQRLCEKGWAVLFYSLRNPFIWANILCIFFYSIDRGCNLRTYVTDPLLRRGQSPAQTISLVFSVLCFVIVVSACIDTDIHPLHMECVCVRICERGGRLDVQHEERRYSVFVQTHASQQRRSKCVCLPT